MVALRVLRRFPVKYPAVVGVNTWGVSSFPDPSAKTVIWCSGVRVLGMDCRLQRFCLVLFSSLARLLSWPQSLGFHDTNAAHPSGINICSVQANLMVARTWLDAWWAEIFRIPVWAVIGTGNWDKPRKP